MLVTPGYGRDARSAPDGIIPVPPQVHEPLSVQIQPTADYTTYPATHSAPPSAPGSPGIQRRGDKFQLPPKVHRIQETGG